MKETTSTSDYREPHEGRGHNTEVRFTFVRHSQKLDGSVVDKDLSGLSLATISPGGVKRAEKFGGEVLAGRKISKAYATKVYRTSQTLESAACAAGLDATEFNKLLRVEGRDPAYFAMPEGLRSPNFIKQYEEKMAGPRTEHIATHFPGKKFVDLTPDEQEDVAEYANEFAVDWWLSFGDQRPDEGTLSPREMAAEVAYKLNRLINLGAFMPNNEKVDLISCGHKTSTEAFLKYALERTADGETVVGFEGDWWQFKNFR